MIELLLILAAFLLGVGVGWFVAMRRVDLQIDDFNKERQ